MLNIIKLKSYIILTSYSQSISFVLIMIQLTITQPMTPILMHIPVFYLNITIPTFISIPIFNNWYNTCLRNKNYYLFFKTITYYILYHYIREIKAMSDNYFHNQFSVLKKEKKNKKNTLIIRKQKTWNFQRTSFSYFYFFFYDCFKK